MSKRFHRFLPLLLFVFVLSAILVVPLFASTNASLAQARRTPRFTLNPERTPIVTLPPVLEGTATVLAATGQSALATLDLLRAGATRTGADEASVAIESYAVQVLGRPVTVKGAAGVAIDDMLLQTAAGAEAQALVSNLAVKSYAAVLEGGAASLSYGSGTVTGDVYLDVLGSSFGVYALLVTQTGALDAAGALELAKQTFPNLAGFAYESLPQETGYAWWAYDWVSSIDPATTKPVTTGQSVTLYVVAGANSATVSATVGRGDFATAIQIPNISFPKP